MAQKKTPKTTKKKTTAKKKQTRNATKLPVSKANLWFNCPGALLKGSKLLKQGSRESELGTMTHDRAVELLTTGRSYIGATGLAEISRKETELIVENAAFYETYLGSKSIWFEDCRSLAAEKFKGAFKKQLAKWLARGPVEGLTFLEAPIETADFIGRVDAITLSVEDEWLAVEIIDLKTGWVAVEPDTEQLKLTAAILKGLFDELKISVNPEFTLTIVQPPLQLIDSVERVVVSTDLEPYRAKAKEARKKKSKLVPGQHCAYCQAKDICPEFKKELEKFLEPRFQDRTFNRVEIWAELIEFLKPVSKIADDVKASTKQALELGVSVPGWRIHYRPGKRQVMSEEKALAVLTKVRKKGLSKKSFVKSGLRSVKEIEDVLKRAGLTQSECDEVLRQLYYQPTTPVLKKE